MAFFTRKQKLCLTAFGIIYTWILVYCRFHSARDPTSYFFQPEASYRPQHSIARVQESLRFLSSSNASAPPGTSATNHTLCVGIVTTKRPQAQHLNVTVGALLDGLSPDQRASLAVHVLFAHVRPQQHPDYKLPWVSRLADHAFTYKDLRAPVPVLRRLERERKVSEKSLFDYRLLLQSCRTRTNAPWIMALEDDVVAQKHWYERTLQAIETVEQWALQGMVNRWLYIRLFYTEKFLGWNAEDWPVYLGWSLVIIAATGCIGLGARRQARSLRVVLTNPFLAILCLVCVPISILLFFLAGRVTVQPMRPGVHIMNRHGCCSQALLYPRERIPLVIDYLERRQRTFPQPVDSVIERLGNEMNMDRLAISPSQMQHVGASSYKDRQFQLGMHGAQGIWSVGFETDY